MPCGDKKPWCSTGVESDRNQANKCTADGPKTKRVTKQDKNGADHGKTRNMWNGLKAAATPQPPRPDKRKMKVKNCKEQSRDNEADGTERATPTASERGKDRTKKQNQRRETQGKPDSASRVIR